MKTITTSIYLLITGLLSVPVVGAPAPGSLVAKSNCLNAIHDGRSRGCNSSGLYFVCNGGVETMYNCEGGCKFDNHNQPVCNNGWLSNTGVPIKVVPIS